MSNKSSGNLNIVDLTNLGPTSARVLSELGIQTESDLREMGVVEAFCLAKLHHPVSLNLLYAMYGALHNLKWDQLSAETKADLKAQVDAFTFTT